jgi:hypothetical protein
MISAADAAKLLAAMVAGIEIADASPINLSDTDDIVFATDDNAEPAADPNPVIAVAGADKAFAVVTTGPPAAPAVAAAAPPETTEDKARNGAPRIPRTVPATPAAARIGELSTDASPPIRIVFALRYVAPNVASNPDPTPF